MKNLIKSMLVLAAFFACTFIIIKSTGILTLEDIQLWLERAKEINPLYLALIVIALLFADLFIAIPTMTVTLMAGYFLGWSMGASAAIAGFFAAGLSGYVISRLLGWRLLKWIYKDEEKLQEMHDAFSSRASVVLVCCRALPILPEVSCCMAGATKMNFMRFLVMFSLGTIPYALIVSYAGSISSLEKPTPAILTAIVLSTLLWFIWYRVGQRSHSLS